MNNANHGHHPTKHSSDSFRTRWRRRIHQIKRYFQEQRAKRAGEEPETKAARNTARATVAIALFTIALVVVGWLQYQEVQDSSDSIDRMNRIYRTQAAQLSRQAAETQTLAERMKDQADRTKDLVDQATVQAKESKIAADATKSAADTARETLHVSERAYLAVVGAQFNFASGSVTINIANSGHLPSGKGEIKVFEGTAYNPNPNPTPGTSDTYTIVERHWNVSQIKEISNGAPRTYFISIPGVTADEVNNGHQIVHLGGVLTYNDGFSGTPDEIRRFCIASVFDVKAKKTLLTNCDPDADLDKLIRDVGYPANKENIPD